MQVERRISIDRPPETVLGYMADIRNDPTWHTDVLEATSTTDDVRVGTVFQVKLKPSMGVSAGTMEVARLEPGRLVQFEGHIGKMTPTVTNTVPRDGALS